MADPKNEDGKTVLADDEAALVTINGMRGWALLLPDPSVGAVRGDEDVPMAVRLLTACMMRSDDDAWVDEMLAWLDERMDAGGEVADRAQVTH